MLGREGRARSRGFARGDAEARAPALRAHPPSSRRALMRPRRLAPTVRSLPLAAVALVLAGCTALPADPTTVRDEGAEAPWAIPSLIAPAAPEPTACEAIAARNAAEESNGSEDTSLGVYPESVSSSAFTRADEDPNLTVKRGQWTYLRVGVNTTETLTIALRNEFRSCANYHIRLNTTSGVESSRREFVALALPGTSSHNVTIRFLAVGDERVELFGGIDSAWNNFRTYGFVVEAAPP